MATQAQKIRAGMFVIISAGLLAVVLIVFGGMRFWERHASYHVVYAGSVIGLEEGAQVYLNGIQVGRVDAIAVARHDLTKVDIRLAVKAGTPVHADTRATLQFAGITGLKVIDLRGGTLTSPRLPEGEVIAQGETTLDRLEKQATELAEQSRGLMTRAQTIVDNLVAITDPRQFEGMASIITQVGVTTDALARTSTALEGMVADNRIALRQTLAAVGHTAERASALMDTEVAGLLTSAGELLGGLRDLVRGNEGPLRSAMFDLRQASRNLKEMSREVRQRPSRLLFSSPQAERRLP